MVRMIGGRVLVAACAVSVAIAAVAVPARAQDPTTTTDTTAPGDPVTTTVPGEPDTTTTAPTILDPNLTTIPGDTTTAPPEDPAAGGDAPSETVPVDTFTIPERTGGPFEEATTGQGFYAGQRPFTSYPGRLVRVSARTARSRAGATQAALDAAVAQRDALLAHQAVLQEELGRLAVQERTAIRALEAAQLQLEHRAADAYIRGTLAPVGMLLSSETVTDYYHQRELLQAVVDADEQALADFQAARRAVDDQQAATAAGLAEVAGQLAAAEQAVAAATLEHEFAQRELAVFLAGGNVVIHGFAFPVAGPTQFGDSFGAPRMVGTDVEHWHEGTDVFAQAGTELVACERGVITRMGTNSLGGITVWLRGESGVSYYYAHLSSYAPGVAAGQLVEAGTVLGYVGNTGNALTTPAHLHFEVHPRGGPAVNPYPLLAVARDQPQPEPIRLG